MAVTGRTLIADALMELGVLAPDETLDPDDAAVGLRRLQALASSWQLASTEWNLPTFDLSTALSLQDGVERALVTNLAIELATPFEASVSALLRDRARDAKQAVIRALFAPRDLSTQTSFEGGGGYSIETA